MRFDINLIIPALAIFTSLLFLVIVSSSQPLTQTRKAYRVFLSTALFWSIASLVLFGGYANTNTWLRIWISGAIAVMLSSFHFVQTSLVRKRKWAAWTYLYGFAAVICIFAASQAALSARIDSSGIHFTFANWIFMVVLPGWALVGFSLYELIREYHRTNDLTHRNRIGYWMAGTANIFFWMLLNWALAGKYPFDILGTLIATLVIGYTIYKKQLPDIEIIIHQALFYTIPNIFIVATYFLIITVAFRIFQAMSGWQIFLISMGVAILSAILVQPLYDKAQSWIERLFFREKYDRSLMLQRVSRTAATFLEVNMLANMILDEIAATLHIDKAAFFLKDKTSKEFRLIAHRNLGKNTNIRLSADHPLINRLNTSEEALGKRHTEILPQFRSLSGQEREALEKLDAELFIPLRTQGNLIGILAAGKKRNGHFYSQGDQATLFTLAHQTAIAIENARLYSDEQLRRRELGALYKLSRELIATDSIKNVLEKVAEHALNSIHVTFTRILLLEDNGTFLCRAIHPVLGLDFELRLGEEDPKTIYRYYEKALKTNEPLVIDRNQYTMTSFEKKILFLEQVQSLCICPLRIGEKPIGIMMLGERRNPIRESFDADKLRLVAAIADQASSAIQRARLHEQLEESFVQTVVALANAIDARDSYTSDHSERLTRLAMATAQKLKCSQEDIQAINWAMLLHDIGKIGVPDEILRKPGPLNDEEWKLMKRHPEIGANIIAPVKRLKNVAPVIRAHHEKYDGTGYPNRLKADMIPIGARVVSIVDTYGAITDNRIYQKARSHDEALREIQRCTGTQFDPVVAAAFFEAIEELELIGQIPQPVG